MTSKDDNTFHGATSSEVGAELAATGRTSASRPFLLIQGFGSAHRCHRVGRWYRRTLVARTRRVRGPRSCVRSGHRAGNGAPGRIPRSAIASYNMLHRTFTALLVLLVSALLHFVPTAIIALSWFAHILVDRAAGFGLRDRQAAIIPPKRIQSWRRGNSQ
jgi:hypothetical protein